MRRARFFRISRSDARFEKTSKKIWRFQKKELPLHHFPTKKRDGASGVDKASEVSKKEKVLYSNIGTVFFEVFEQLKFIHSSE